MADFLLMPSECADMDLHAVGTVLPGLARGRVPHRIVFTRVWPTGLPGAVRTREQYRADGWPIANTIVCRYSVRQDTVVCGRAIAGVPGQGPSRLAAKQDVRDLAREVAQHLALDVDVPRITLPQPTANSTSARHRRADHEES